VRYTSSTSSTTSNTNSSYSSTSSSSATAAVAGTAVPATAATVGITVGIAVADVAADVFAWCVTGSSVACTAWIEQRGYLQLCKLVPVQAVEESVPFHLQWAVTIKFNTTSSVGARARSAYAAMWVASYVVLSLLLSVYTC
jgi:hypothetical protein